MEKKSEALRLKNNRILSEKPLLSLKLEPGTIIQEGDLVGEALKAKVMYLCDRRACKHCGEKSMGLCRHTNDIAHAKNFEAIHGKFFEKNTADIESSGREAAPRASTN